MASPPRKTFRRSILAEGVLLHGLLLSAAHATDLPPAALPESFAAEQSSGELLLDVSINEMGRGVLPFAWRDGNLWSDATVLRKLGFRLPAETSNSVRLSTLQGLELGFDVAHLTLKLVAPLAALDLPKTVINATETTRPEANSSPGLLLNYDIYGTQGRAAASSLSAFTELRAFNGHSVFSSTALTQSTRSEGSPWQSHSARLDTTWNRSFPDDLLTLRVGDTVTAALPWSRSTRIGGIQLASNFALQPYRNTAPLPAFLGSAALPSDVELFVNGMRQYSGQVPAGPFQMNTLPSVNSTGAAQVVLTDSFGRATTINFSLYDTGRLLAKGLTDWSVDVGAVRKNYGLRSFDYGQDLTASGTWRRGMTDYLTVEAHGEAVSGSSNAGAGGVVQLGSFGLVSGALSHSAHREGSGTQTSLGYSWLGDRLSFGVSGMRAQGNYRDVASLYGSATPKGTGRASAGYNSGDFGNFSMSYLFLRYAGQDSTRLANFSWFKSLNRSASISVGFNQNLDRKSEHNLFVGFTWALGDRINMGIGIQRDGERSSFTADAQQAAPMEGGVGWRATTRLGGGTEGGQAEVNYLGHYGRVAVGVNALGESRTAYANATGGVVLMGGQVFASRRIDDAFAVVSTDGVAGVPVKLENQVVGNTDERGMLLITPLNAYQNNKINIDPMHLPSDVRVERTQSLVAPTDRAGVMVRFGITPIRAASVSLTDRNGLPMPIGTEVRLFNAASVPSIVGFDGIVYLENLDAHNVLEVKMVTGVCQAEFDHPKGTVGVPPIGPLVCTTKTLP